MEQPPDKTLTHYGIWFPAQYDRGRKFKWRIVYTLDEQGNIIGFRKEIKKLRGAREILRQED